MGKCGKYRNYGEMTYMFKVHAKIINIYMVKYNISTLCSRKIMGFFVNTKEIHIYNVIFSKTVTKLVTILAKCFFPSLNPTSYLK